MKQGFASEPGLCRNVRPLLSRRAALQSMSCGFGWLALNDLLAHSRSAQALGMDASSKTHFAAKAKRVIFLCMRGGPSHVDTLDYKPKLIADSGQAGRRRGSQLLGSPWDFKQSGESGLWLSNLLPNLQSKADKLCVIKSMQTDVPAHPQAVVALHTGTSRFVRPSLGAWTLYGLGSENENLPGFVTITPPSAFGGSQNYGSGFLPADTQATRIGTEGRPLAAAVVSNLEAQQNAQQQKRELGLLHRLNVAQLNRDKLNRDKLNLSQSSRDPASSELPSVARAATAGDAEVEGLIKSFELGFRMQSELPDVLDLNQESAATQRLYGIGENTTDDFGRKCLLARRMVEAGVRFVEVTHGNWDQHFNLKNALEGNCQAIDKPAAGLLADLEARGLLEDTLVIWSGEFGRTPHAQGNDGRDHNHTAFSCWMAGGGVKGGASYGESDEYGYEAVVNPVTLHDWHATILHLLGFDHERLTFNYAGRDFRLTDVYGHVIQDIVA